MLAERWLDQMSKCLEILEVEDDGTFIRLATFQFRDLAKSEWRSIRDSKDIANMTWERFCQLFLERHFPVVVRIKRG